MKKSNIFIFLCLSVMAAYINLFAGEEPLKLTQKEVERVTQEPEIKSDQAPIEKGESSETEEENPEAEEEESTETMEQEPQESEAPTLEQKETISIKKQEPLLHTRSQFSGQEGDMEPFFLEAKVYHNDENNKDWVVINIADTDIDKKAYYLKHAGPTKALRFTGTRTLRITPEIGQEYTYEFGRNNNLLTHYTWSPKGNYRADILLSSPADRNSMLPLEKYQSEILYIPQIGQRLYLPFPGAQTKEIEFTDATTLKRTQADGKITFYKIDPRSQKPIATIIPTNIIPAKVIHRELQPQEEETITVVTSDGKYEAEAEKITTNSYTLRFFENNIPTVPSVPITTKTIKLAWIVENNITILEVNTDSDTLYFSNRGDKFSTSKQELIKQLGGSTPQQAQRQEKKISPIPIKKIQSSQRPAPVQHQEQQPKILETITKTQEDGDNEYEAVAKKIGDSTYSLSIYNNNRKMLNQKEITSSQLSLKWTPNHILEVTTDSEIQKYSNMGELVEKSPLQNPEHMQQEEKAEAVAPKVENPKSIQQKIEKTRPETLTAVNASGIQASVKKSSSMGIFIVNFYKNNRPVGRSGPVTGNNVLNLAWMNNGNILKVETDKEIVYLTEKGEETAAPEEEANQEMQQQEEKE